MIKLRGEVSRSDDAVDACAFRALPRHRNHPPHPRRRPRGPVARLRRAAAARHARRVHRPHRLRPRPRRGCGRDAASRARHGPPGARRLGAVRAHGAGLPVDGAARRLGGRPGADPQPLPGLRADDRLAGRSGARARRPAGPAGAGARVRRAALRHRGDVGDHGAVLVGDLRRRRAGHDDPRRHRRPAAGVLPLHGQLLDVVGVRDRRPPPHRDRPGVRVDGDVLRRGLVPRRRGRLPLLGRQGAAAGGTGRDALDGGLRRLRRRPRPRRVPAPARRYPAVRDGPPVRRSGGDGRGGLGRALRAGARVAGQADLQRDLARRALGRHRRRVPRAHPAPVGRPGHREAGRHQPHLGRRRERAAVRPAGDRSAARPPAAPAPTRGDARARRPRRARRARHAPDIPAGRRVDLGLHPRRARSRVRRADRRRAHRARLPAPPRPATAAGGAGSASPDASEASLLAPSGSKATPSPAPSLPGEPS